MLNWIKILILKYLLFALRLSMVLYKTIYMFLDKFIPDGILKEDCSEDKNVYDREDIFSGEKFPDDFFDDDEFCDKEVDDFKEMLTVGIMFVIAIAGIVLLIKGDIWLTKYSQQARYLANDVFDSGLLAGW